MTSLLIRIIREMMLFRANETHRPKMLINLGYASASWSQVAGTNWTTSSLLYLDREKPFNRCELLAAAWVIPGVVKVELDKKPRWKTIVRCQYDCAVLDDFSFIYALFTLIEPGWID
ncbi:MAG: hypothetical protein H7Y17_05650 [Chlorobia bacterium]|nr:hypothetical protein [Fimbriimonadaceae bacterium]